MGKPFLFCMLKSFFYSFILIALQNWHFLERKWRLKFPWGLCWKYCFTDLIDLISFRSNIGELTKQNQILFFLICLVILFCLFFFWCSYTYFMQIYYPNNVHFQFQLDTFFLIQKYTNNIPDWKQRHTRKNIMTPSSKLLVKSAFIKLSYLVLLGYLKYKVPVDDYSTAVTSSSIKEAELNCSMLLFLKKIN